MPYTSQHERRFDFLLMKAIEWGLTETEQRKYDILTRLRRCKRTPLQVSAEARASWQYRVAMKELGQIIHQYSP